MSDSAEPPQDAPHQDDGRSAAAPGGAAREPGAAPAPTPAPDRDSPWKEALDRWLEPFAALLFPRLHALVDWSRGWEALDAELQAVVRDAELGRRLADRLYRVWRRDGAEAVLYVHVEVQGAREAGFEERLFVYFSRLRDRYGGSVITLAVLADDDPGWRPGAFEEETADHYLCHRPPTVKLLDFAEPARRAELEASTSPAALVVLAHLDALATRGAPEARAQAKQRLTRHLYRRGFDRAAILELYRVLDWLLELPADLERAQQALVLEIEEEHTMPRVISAVRIAAEDAKKEGLEKGREEGLEKGREEGLGRAVLVVLEARFQQALPEPVVARLRAGATKPVDLEAAAREAAVTPSLEAFTAWLEARKA